MAVRIRDVVKRLKKEGWVLVRQSGSHMQFKHPTKPGRVTIAGHPADQLDAGTFNSVKKQAGWK
jgi:predicted RNA binding protein YcfA (HicA-like mRNA interferase family)